MILSEPKRKTLEDIVNDLQLVEQITAVVLGGSHCIGMAGENADLDIGVYYHNEAPFDIKDVERIARKYAIEEPVTVTDFYHWGPWVNGGAWINTTSGEVDLLYRNIEQISSTIEKSKNGIWENDFEQQPPYGFSSVIYLGETYYCHTLYDPYDVIKDMKGQVAAYPLKLKKTIVQRALWSAEFSIWQSVKYAKKQDMYNAGGCFTRALKNIVEALYALNEMYFIGDNNSIQRIEQAPKCPDRIKEQIDSILSITPDTLTLKANRLRILFEQVTSLAEGMYHPYYVLW
jgi:hypothetical protein